MPRLTDPQIEEALRALPGWRRDGDALVRDLRFRDFTEAFGFLAQLATIQERLDHHAAISNTYADVSLRVWSHDAGGVTERDIELARRVNERAPA